MIDFEVLEDLLSYHPPANEDEQKPHEIVNEASLAYAKALASVVTNPADYTVLLRQLMTVRMLANQFVCNQRVGIAVRDVFGKS